MSEAIGIVVRRRRSRAEAERLVSEFEQSGLRRQAFCARHGLSVGTLDYYRKHRRPLEGQFSAQGPATAQRFLPVELVSRVAPAQAAAVESQGGLWLELGNGRRIEVGQGFDVSTLERLVAVLERT
jgi:transposase-like protein